MAQRRKYSEEFKREAVGLIRQPGANVTQIAKELGVRSNLLFRWRREVDVVGKKAFPGLAWRATRSCWRSSASWHG